MKLASVELDGYRRFATRQSSLEVLLDLDNNILSILIRSTGRSYESLSERSEGLRQFVALSVFLSRRVRKQSDIVLLIDEAEAHLHYDAQADLVQMLANQNLARQVIYTTHSMGCFPGDFGAGVRVLRTDEPNGSSEILNKLWIEDGMGLSPILTGMGAETMAFFPFRSCVLTEGAGDILLLPALLRAAGQETLEFHVLPGLAEINGHKIPIIQNSGRHVVFLLDGDEGGDAIQRKLVREGISRKIIFRLRSAGGAKCVIEDFISKDVYVAAINAELARSDRQVRIRSDELPDVMRAAALEAWCKQHAIRAPAKVAIAYEVIEQMYDKDIVDRAHIEGLLSTRDHIANVLRAKAAEKKRATAKAGISSK
jgi:predicted ATP-dependent endonuclease of OLD family